MNIAAQAASTRTHGREASVDDRDLVEAARRGDRDAFKTLFERYHRRAYALAFGVLRHQDDALDVVQDAFIKAHRYLDKFEGSSSFYTWLVGAGLTPIIPSGAIDDALLPRILGGNPGRALVDKEIRARIDQALGELSENHRAVIVMRELDGLSYEEMATAMRCSKGTIMSRLFHARKNMQRRLIDLIDHPSAELLKELGQDVGDDKERAANG